MFSASDLFDDWFDLCQEPLPLQWLSLKFIEILMLYVYVPICSSFRTPKRFPWHASLGLEIHLRCTVLQALLWPESAGATASTSRSVDQRERLIARASPAIVPISDWCFAPTEFSIVAKQRTDDLWANEHKVYATFSVSLHKKPCIRLEIRSFVEWIHWFWLILKKMFIHSKFFVWTYCEHQERAPSTLRRDHTGVAILEKQRRVRSCHVKNRKTVFFSGCPLFIDST